MSDELDRLEAEYRVAQRTLITLLDLEMRMADLKTSLDEAIGLLPDDQMLHVELSNQWSQVQRLLVTAEERRDVADAELNAYVGDDV